MKKKMIMLLIAVSVCAMLTGCGGKKKETEVPTEAATEVKTEAVTETETEPEAITENETIVIPEQETAAEAFDNDTVVAVAGETEDDMIEAAETEGNEGVDNGTVVSETETETEVITEDETIVVTETEKATETETEKATETETESEEEAIELEEGVYSVIFDTDSGMFRVNEACEDRGILTVKDGKMMLHVTLAGKGILNLFVGTAEEAKQEGAELLEHTEDEVTYKDGFKETVYGFDIPVPVVGQHFNIALIGKKEKWYDHKVIVKDPQKIEAETELETETAESETETESASEA